MVSVEATAPGKFEFKATNVGKTPAKITAIYYANSALTRDQKFEVTPEYEKGESLMGAPLGLLPSSASIIICRFEHAEMRGNRSPEEWQSFFARGFANVFTYGKIAYYDTLEVSPKEPHLTKWFYWHLPMNGALPIADPRRPEYNTYT